MSGGLWQAGGAATWEDHRAKEPSKNEETEQDRQKREVGVISWN